MSRTRWLIVGIVVLRVIVFLAALVVARRGGVARAPIQIEAAMLTAIAVWLLMLQFLPRLRDQGFAILDAPRGALRSSLSALAMLGIVVGAAIVAIVGRNLVFAGTLVVVLLLALEFSSGVVLSSLGYHLRRAALPDATRRPLVDLVLGAQILSILISIRLVAVVSVVALGFLALGVIALLALAMMKGREQAAAI